MGITNSNKELSTSQIQCGGTFTVTLSLTAEPNIINNPTDIVLVLDRSNDMLGEPLANLQAGASKFISIVDEATDTAADGQIGFGSRIGIVSFADTATVDAPLTTSVAALNTAVNALTAGGSTNHEAAFTAALSLFDPTSANAKVIVMFTDGITSAGGDANAVATAAKEQGVTIYEIGIEGSEGIFLPNLNEWASDPDTAYVAVTPSDAQLESLFGNLGANITRAGATNIVLTDNIAPCFRITGVSSPTKGTASITGTNTVNWSIPSLGVTASEGAAFTFTVEHIGPCSGVVEVNESIAYSDTEGNTVTFPSPTLNVECSVIICPEGCPDPVDITVSGCTDTVEFDAGTVGLESGGSILSLNLTLQRVCPNRRVALAVILNEVDEDGNEYKRGMKILTVPAHTRDTCQDIAIQCLKFVLPESLDVSPTTGVPCNERFFRARFITNYIDNDYECCCQDDTP